MNKRLKDLFRGIILSFFILTNAGCVALLLGAVAGAGGVAWVKGILEKNVDVSIEKTFNATKEGLRKLKLPVIEEKIDLHSATIKSEFSDGKNIGITIKALTERSTKIRIRIGLWGDRTKSEMILSAITNYL